MTDKEDEPHGKGVEKHRESGSVVSTESTMDRLQGTLWSEVNLSFTDPTHGSCVVSINKSPSEVHTKLLKPDVTENLS